MSRGPGLIQRAIFKNLDEFGSMSVYALSYYCHGLKGIRYKDNNLHSSVCRTVRRLEKDGFLKSEKVSYDYLDEEFKYRFTKLENYPTYVKLIWLDIRE
jgi:hypothetical protein